MSTQPTLVDHRTQTSKHVSVHGTAVVSGGRSGFGSLSARALRRSLSQIEQGELVLADGIHVERFGSTAKCDLQARVTVRDPGLYQRLVFDGALGAAESYLEGEWDADDLASVFRVLLRNEHVLEGFSGVMSRLAAIRHRWGHFRNRNSKSGSRRNIHAHYDLGNEFFSLFLDPTMMYSSAIFPNQQSSLEEGSLEKVDRVCRQLQLQPDEHVVEIGTGWGTFAIHAARHYGCRVTSTTISDEQFRMATDRVREAGLEDRVTLLKQDYRDLEGKYDKLVSIEMIEAVGRKFLDEYFRKCCSLLKEDGAMMIQAITLPEQRYEGYEDSVDFIQKYIFPGGFLPSIRLMQDCVAKQTDLRMLALDDFGVHYARTLRFWNQAFHERLAEVRELGFDDRFIRMWRYYLCYCEAAFLERATGLVQVLWGRPQCGLGRA
ncbi:MAG: class I SAM-dependent methyltransferase [Planctomycetaceae bacterium]